MHKRDNNFLIKLISEQSQKYISSELKPYGITFTQLNILVLLFSPSLKKPVSQKTLESALRVSHPTIVGVLKVMENNGLITTAFDAADKRVKNVYPTDLATDIHQRVNQTGRAMEEKAFKNFTDEEIDTLYRLLKKQYDNLYE